MSTLKQLIKKFCPQGVEYVRLGDVCNLVIGFAFKSNLFRDIGNPICRTKDIQENKIDFSSMKCFNLDDYSKNLKKYIIEPNDIVIGMSGTIKIGINKTSKNCYLNQRVGKFVCDKTKIVDKFLYYFLCNSVSSITKKISDGSVKNLGNNDLLEMQIPLPPLRVQEEIVKILDKFTDLENELENELRMRKMQFNAYRDKLLTFDNGVKFEKLGDSNLFKITRGTVISKDYIKKNPGPYPVYSSQTKYDGCIGYIDSYMINNECVTWTTDGEKAGTVFYRNGKFNATNVCGVIYIINNGKVSCKYLSYILDKLAHRYVKRDISNPKLMSNVVKEIQIPVPPLEKQKEIVEKLDKFNEMCNEISDGLPLEIELRKKQYEFCRDRLLSFDKKS